MPEGRCRIGMWELRGRRSAFGESRLLHGSVERSSSRSISTDFDSRETAPESHNWFARDQAETRMTRAVGYRLREQEGRLKVALPRLRKKCQGI